MEEKKLKKQLAIVRLKSNTQLPEIIEAILKEDIWAPVKFSYIFHRLLFMAEILPSTYRRINTKERAAHLSRGYRAEKKGIYKDMHMTEKAVIHSIEKNFNEIKLEPYEKIPREGISLYLYQQSDYNKKLLSYINNKMEYPFERITLIEKLCASLNEPAGIKISGVLELFVNEGILTKVTGYRDVAYVQKE